MIQIRKNVEPQVLQNNAVSWREELLQCLKDNGGIYSKVPETIKNRYQHLEIKNSLVEESHGKCTYCESKLKHISWGEIEHILPKSLSPENSFTWNNLLLACSVCNNAKKIYLSETEPLINPVTSNPATEITFLGHLIWHTLNSATGKLTIGKLELNRTELVQRRQERLDALSALIDNWASLQNRPNMQELAWNQLVQEASPAKEYSAAAKAFIQQRCGKSI
jgi:uncharacterized protein (TIGR02646 family)